MNREYAEKRIRDALKASGGNVTAARQQVIAWAFDDTKLLHELVAPHITGIAAHAVNNVAAYAYAMFTTSVAELRAISAISWVDAFWDIAGFALFAVVAWRIARAMRLATVTP